MQSAAESGRGAGKSARAEINVTPLIDIVLVMLIIFMVLTPTLMKHLTVTVPPPARAEVDAGLPPITLALSAGRAMALNGEAVTFEQLPAQVSSRLRFDRRKLVFFDVDDACAYGDVIKAMDMVRGAGARVLGVVTAARIP
jgi:biopolymer transport protein ExbD